MKSIFLSIVIISFTYLLSCSQSYDKHGLILKSISNDCKNIIEKLNTSNSCRIEFSTQVIPISITPFHDIIDSLGIMANGIESSFDRANMFDIENHKDAYDRAELMNNNYKSNDHNLRLYCSDSIGGFITCELVKITDSGSINDLRFGKSLVYLFKDNIEHHEVQLIEIAEILNN